MTEQKKFRSYECFDKKKLSNKCQINIKEFFGCKKLTMKRIESNQIDASANPFFLASIGLHFAKGASFVFTRPNSPDKVLSLSPNL